jgi:hypothetical protein
VRRRLGTLTIALFVAAGGCGNTGEGAADARSDGAAPDAGKECVAAGGTCSQDPFCVGPGPQNCGPNAYCCFDAICAPDGSVPPIEASSYDQSCRSDSDCVAVSEGDVCTPCGIGCTNAAINAAGLARYKADVASANAATRLGMFGTPYQCVTTCPYSRRPCCASGQCHADAACSGPSLESDADTPDAAPE